MGKRRKAREVALQLLYQLDVQGESHPEPHLPEFWTRHPVDREVREFAEILNSRTSRSTGRSEEHTSELQSPYDLVCRLLLDKKNAAFQRNRYRTDRRFGNS